MTETSIEATQIEQLDFEPAIPCEFVSLHEYLRSQEPAEWVITFIPMLPCGCTPVPNPLICDTCWKALNEAEFVHCVTCSKAFELSRVVIDARRINP